MMRYLRVGLWLTEPTSRPTLHRPAARSLQILQWPSTINRQPLRVPRKRASIPSHKIVSTLVYPGRLTNQLFLEEEVRVRQLGPEFPPTRQQRTPVLVHRQLSG